MRGSNGEKVSWAHRVVLPGRKFQSHPAQRPGRLIELAPNRPALRALRRFRAWQGQVGAAQGSWTPFSSPSGEQRGGTSAVISGREGLPRGACREGLGRFRPVRRLGLRLPSMFGARACSCRKASGGLRSHWDLHDWRLAWAPAWARDVMGSWGGARLLEWVPSGVGPIWEWDAVGIRGKGRHLEWVPSGAGTSSGHGMRWASGASHVVAEEAKRDR